MELRNNNRKAIKALAKVNYKNNKSRNILLIIGVALAVITIFSVFSIVAGRIDAQYVMGVREAGNDATTVLLNPSKKQISKVDGLPYIKKTAKEWGLGAYLSDGYPAFYCNYIDESNFNIMYKPAYSDMTGDFPDGANEVMMPLRALKMLGIKDPKVGMDIEFQVNMDHKKTDKRVFTLSGFFTEYAFSSAPTAFFSKAYAEDMSADFSDPSLLLIQQQDNLDMYSVEEKLYRDVKMVDDTQQFLGGNSMTYEAVADIYGGYEIGIGFMILVFLCVFLLINNVMSISFARDVKHYGLLKTLGATGRQITSIISHQILRITAIGIAFGTVISCAFVFGILPRFLERMYLHNYGPASQMMGFHMEYLLLAMGFALVIAFVSILGPTRKISRISPIEAVRYHETSTVTKSQKNKAETGGKLFRLAWRNVFSSKKKAVFTITSLVLGLSLALTSMVVVGGLDITNSIEADDDFDLLSEYTAFAHNEEYSDRVQVIDQSFQKSIESIDGIDEINYLYGTEVVMNLSEKAWKPLIKANNIKLQDKNKLSKEEFKKENRGSVGIVSDKKIKELEEYVLKNNLDIDLKGLKNGTHGVALHFHEFSPRMEKESQAAKNETFTVQYWDGGKAGTLRLAGYLDMQGKGFPDIDRNAASMKGMPGVIVSEKAYKELGLVKHIHKILLNVQDEYEPQIKEKITELCTQRTLEIKKMFPDAPNIDHIGLRVIAKSDTLADAQSYIVSMRLIMYSIAALLLLVGIMNYYNVIATSILSRKKQFAVLEAIGMTRKQLQKMLIFEGCYYFTFVTGFLLTLGTTGMVLLGNLIKQDQTYFRFSYPYIEALIVVALLLAFCIMLPLRMYQSTTKESAIERLRHVR